MKHKYNSDIVLSESINFRCTKAEKVVYNSIKSLKLFQIIISNKNIAIDVYNFLKNKKLLSILFFCFIMLLSIKSVDAKTIKYYNSNGSYSGKFVINNNRIKQYNSKGNYSGSYKQTSTGLRCYNSKGRYIGKIK